MAAAVGTDDDGFGYGLGVFNVAGVYGPSVGHAGIDYGFASRAGCLLEQDPAVVALTNGEGDAGPSMALPLVDVLSSG
jgi:hypothetical protein